MSDREHLVEALRAGRPREASRLARRLARGGAGDDLVAATIVLHAKPDAAERGEAEVRLALPLCLARIAAGGDDWEELARLLFLRGEGEAALRALWAGADAAGWQRTILWLYEAGARPAAAIAATLAVARFANDAELWSMRALLALEEGERKVAAAACARALALEPAAPGPYLTLAALARRADEAREALAAARARGAPVTIVEGWAALLAG